MNPTPKGAAFPCQPRKDRPGAGPLGQKSQRRAFEQAIDGFDCFSQRRWIANDARIGDDCDTFVNTGPGNRPRAFALGEATNAVDGPIMVGQTGCTE